MLLSVEGVLVDSEQIVFEGIDVAGFLIVLESDVDRLGIHHGFLAFRAAGLVGVVQVLVLPVLILFYRPHPALFLGLLVPAGPHLLMVFQYFAVLGFQSDGIQDLFQNILVGLLLLQVFDQEEFL